MSDINAGEYIRTKYGINKITKIGENCYWLEKPIADEIEGSIICYSSKRLKILKHSPDIIDLIEVGDYVNGYRVVDITIARHKPSSGVEIDCSGESEDAYLWVDEIESIVTKEQFESMKYHVGGKEE